MKTPSQAKLDRAVSEEIERFNRKQADLRRERGQEWLKWLKAITETPAK